MNAYEWKQERRRERLEARAAKLSSAGRATVDGAWSSLRQIPPGQPILIGHHSEKRHRAHLARVDRALSRGFRMMDAAAEAQRRAAAVGDAGISSDDPDAVAKLSDKVGDLEAMREEWKAANAYYRKHKTLDGAPISDATRTRAASNLVHSWQKVPFPGYALTNLGARIRSAKARAVTIVATAAQEHTTETVNGCTITVDPDDNRVRLTFPARLSRADYATVRAYGWLWSPSRNAFVRKLSSGATWQARDLAQKLGTAR